MEKHLKRTKLKFNKLLAQYKDLFYYGCVVDTWMPEITLLPFVSLQWKLDPTWYRVVAPPGSGKSQHLSLLEDFELTYTIDDFTPKSFVSGFRGIGGGDPSQLPQFDGKVIIVSDESTLMEQRQEDRNIIQSILRKAFDGKFSKSFGNLESKQEYNSHFNMLLGSTPAIDRYYSYQQALGERYINFRAQIPNREALTNASFKNLYRGFGGKKEALKIKVHEFIRQLPDVDFNAIRIPLAMERMLIECADLIALIRTRITRDSSGRQVTTLPQAESASRLIKQLAQTAVSNAIIRGDSVVSKVHVSKAVYLGLGSIAAITIFILFNIWSMAKDHTRLEDSAWFSVQEIVLKTALSRFTVAQILEDLAIHRVLDIRQGRKQGGRLIEYRINVEMMSTINMMGLFTYYVPPIKEILTMHKVDRFTDGKPKGLTKV